MEKEKLPVEPETSQEKNLVIEPTHRIRFESFRLLIHAPTTQLKNEEFKANIIKNIILDLKIQDESIKWKQRT